MSLPPNQDLVPVSPSSDTFQLSSLAARRFRFGVYAGLAVILLGVVSGNLGLFVVGVVLLVSGILVMRALKKAHHEKYWDEPSLLLPELGVRLGESFEASFRQGTKQPEILSSSTVSADLVCEEWVRYKSGSSTHTKTSKRRKIPLVPSSIADDLALVASLPLSIPTDLGPSFELPNNRVSWHVSVVVATPEVPDAKYEFPLTVLPEFWRPNRAGQVDPNEFRPPSPGSN